MLTIRPFVLMLSVAAAGPAFAASSSGMSATTCDDAAMKTMQAKIDGMADSDQKKTAAEELAAAKLSVKADKLKDCSSHLDSAMKAIGNTM